MNSPAAHAVRSGTSIATRLLLGLTATVGFSTALVIVLLAIYEVRGARRNLTNDINGSISAFAQLIEPALWDVDSARMHRIADAFARDPRIARLTVREATMGFTAIVEPRHSADTALRTLEVRRNGTVLGEVSIAFDREFYNRAIYQQIFGAIGVSLIALIATLLAFQLLFRRMLRRPLDDLSVAVRRYGANAYQPEGLILPYSEFHELAGVLEAMSFQIRDQFQALGAANRELGAMNWFLTMTSRDINPRDLVAEVAQELKSLFGASQVQAEVAPERGEPQRVVDDSPESRLDPSQLVALEVPIVVSGERAGAITLRRESTRPFADAEVSLANAVASQIAASVSRYRARSGERLLRTAVEQLPESVIIADPQMRMVYVNPAFTAMTGYSMEEAVGKVPRDLKRVTSSDPRDDAVITQVAQGGTFIGRLRSRRKNGTIYYEDSLITPVRDEDGVITNHISISRDVTREMEREDQFRHSQRMDAIGQLAGGVAHDFNNMLAIVIMQLDLLEGELRLTPDQTESLQNMRGALDRAANLTRQLLMFSRRQAMRVQEHDLDAIVDQMLRILRRIIGEKIEVDYVHAPSQVAFEGDAGMIEQVLLNLCVNARDAMPNGGTLTIRSSIDDFDATTAHPGRWAHLSVRDTGTGMSKEVQQRIFEPFFTTKGVGHGTGLGLATTHGIVAQHNGWIEVDSEPGKGSTFHVYLPALSQSPGRVLEVHQRSERHGTATILVVEDEDVVRRMVAQSLRKLGHRVLEAPNGPEAIRLVRNDGIGDLDVVLTDMVMPNGMSGLELVDELRRISPGLRAVVMSGYSLQLANDAVPDDIGLLPKPFSLEALDRAISDALE